MIKIIIEDNKKCKLITEDINIIRKIRNTLSFKVNGVEYTAAYKNGWNGITYLMSESGVFPLGLINKVKDFLQTKSLEFTIEDKRAPFATSQELNITNNLKKLNIVPRDYQEDIVNACLKVQKGIVRACTSSGKTIAAGLLTAKINKPTIIYVIGLDLLQQFHDLFKELFDEPIGFIGNGVCEIHRINIASVWTIARSLKVDKSIVDDESVEELYDEKSEAKIAKMLQETKVHIFDECHRSTMESFKAIYKKIDVEHIYGFSGTPYRDDGSDLLATSILGEKIIDISASLLISKGVLPQPIIKFTPVPKMTTHSTTYTEVYKNYIVENETRNNLILDSIKKLLDKQYIPLVLFKQISHGEKLCKMLENEGIPYEFLYGKDSLEKRNEVKKNIEEGKSKLVLASTIFDTGVNLPRLSALVLCGGGKSSISSLQRIGRCLRPYKDKKNVAIVDFYDQVKFLKKHSMLRHKVYKTEEGFKIIKCKEMR
jgi:superfamily II DNA or RNA helicase